MNTDSFSSDRSASSEEVQAPPPHPLDELLPEICQLIDAVKAEWSRQGCWSQWDQSVRDRIAAYNIQRHKAAAPECRPLLGAIMREMQDLAGGPTLGNMHPDARRQAIARASVTPKV